MRRLRALDGRWTSDRGSVVPAFLTLCLVTVVMGVVFLQVGRGADLGAEAQTGADGAALAAARELEHQAARHFDRCIARLPSPCPPWYANFGRALRAAQDYAARNGTRVVADQPRQHFLGVPWVFEATFAVEVETTTALDGAGMVMEEERTGREQGFTVGEGTRGIQDAQAYMGQGLLSFSAATGITSFQYLDGQIFPVARTSGGSCSIPDDDLRALAVRAGVSETFAATESSLARYDACDGGTGGIAAAGLAEEMKVALLRLEASIGQPLNIVSAYRSAQAQALVCARVTGPCAPPGRSMHQQGLAVDVASVNDDSLALATQAINADPDIGLCQPLPTNDANHLVHRSASECGGRTGTLGQGDGPAVETDPGSSFADGTGSSDGTASAPSGPGDVAGGATSGFAASASLALFQVQLIE